MAGLSKERALQLKQEIIERDFAGNEELYRLAMSERGKKGGQKSGTGGFGAGEEGRRKASIAGLRSVASKRRKKEMGNE